MRIVTILYIDIRVTLQHAIALYVVIDLFLCCLSDCTNFVLTSYTGSTFNGNLGIVKSNKNQLHQIFQLKFSLYKFPDLRYSAAWHIAHVSATKGTVAIGQKWHEQLHLYNYALIKLYCEYHNLLAMLLLQIRTHTYRCSSSRFCNN